MSFVVLPAFAFTNFGLSLSGITPAMAFDPITLGTVVGLFLGKQLGIFAAAGGLIRLGYARLPEGARWGQLYGVGVCGGIGEITGISQMQVSRVIRSALSLPVEPGS